MLLVILSTSTLCLAQILVDEYGFYRSWQELNNRFFAKQVQLDERGLEAGTDTRTSKLSDQAEYRVSVEPYGDPAAKGYSEPPFNQIHSWRIKVQPVDGEVAKDLEIEFFGGMPLHNHGFPTSPVVHRGAEAGAFRVDGIKFSMSGWWQFAMAIKTTGKVNTVRFNLVIKP